MKMLRSCVSTVFSLTKRRLAIPRPALNNLPMFAHYDRIMSLDEHVVELLNSPSVCFITTLMPDGSPQVTQTWVDTDGKDILINTVQGFQKLRNIERDPRVAVAVSDPNNPSRYIAIRGRVVNVTEAGGVDHIEKLSQKYLGGPYPWFGGRDQTRVILTISADKVTSNG